MKTLKHSLFAATALGVGLAFAVPGSVQAQQEPTPAEQLASPEFTEDMQSAIRGYFEATEPAQTEPGTDTQVTVGTAPPTGVQTFPMPAELVADLPEGDYQYFATDTDIVVINQADQTVAAVIPRS